MFTVALILFLAVGLYDHFAKRDWDNPCWDDEDEEIAPR